MMRLPFPRRRRARHAFASPTAAIVLAASCVAAAVAAPASPGASAPATAPAASATPAFSPPPPAQVDPAVTLRAKEWLHRLQTGTIDRTQLSAETDREFTSALVKRAVTELGPLGQPTEFTFVSAETGPAGTGYIYRVSFAAVKIVWLFALDQNAKVSGLIYGAAH